MNQRRRDLLRMHAGELMTAGIPLDIYDPKLNTVDQMSGGLLITQVGHAMMNSISISENGLVKYSLDLAIVNNLMRPVQILELDLETPWPDPTLAWLQECAYPDTSTVVYRFEDEPLGLSPRDVVNHAIHHKKKLQPGESWEGLLLGQGRPQVPSHFSSGTPITAKLAVTISYGYRFSKEVHLVLDRSMEAAGIKKALEAARKPRIPLCKHPEEAELAGQVDAGSRTQPDAARRN